MRSTGARRDEVGVDDGADIHFEDGPMVFSFLINFELCRLKFHLPWMDPRCRSNGSRYCSWKFGVDALKLRPSAVLPWW